MNRFIRDKVLTKDSLIALLVGLAVALTALCFIYLDNIQRVSPYIQPSQTLPEVTSGQNYRQEFTCTEDGLSSVGVFSASFMRFNAGTFSFRLEDKNGGVIETWTTDAGFIPDNIYYNLNLTDLIKDSKGKTYILDISSDCTFGTAPTFYISEGQERGLTLNGDPLDGSLCYQLRYEVPVTSFISAGLILKTVLILILTSLAFVAVSLIFPAKKLWLIAFPCIAVIIGYRRMTGHSDLTGGEALAMGRLYVIYCFLWIIGSVLLYRLIFVRKLSVEKLAVIVLSVFSLFTILLLTPGAGNDEQVHFAYSYKYANVFSFKGFSDPVDEDGDGIVQMRQGDKELLETMTDVPVFITWDSYRSVSDKFEMISSDNSLHDYKLQDLMGFPSFNTANSPLGYVAPGIGIAIGRLLHLGTIPTFYLGRIFNAALFILLVFLSIKIIPIGKQTLFVFALFPMVLQQTATYSYDSITIGFAFLFTAMTVQVFRSKEKIPVKTIILLGLVSAGLALSKYVYVPLILILLALPSSRYNVRKPKLLKGIIIGSIIVFGLITFAVLQHLTDISQLMLPSFAQSIRSPFIIAVRYFEMLVMNAVSISDFYVHTLVAYPGWFQIYIPVTIVTAYYILLIFSMFRRKDEKGFPKAGLKLYGAILIIISCVLISLPMAAKFTNVDSDTVDSIQGRYFIPLIPFICLGLRSRHIRVDGQVTNKILYGAGYLSFLFFAYCLLKLFYAV